MATRVLLNGEQFPALANPSLGLLVGLKVPHDVTDDDVISHVVLGRCGCVPSPDPSALPTLSRHELPSPQWVKSWEGVRGCFPGGCDVCGVWVCVEGGGAVREIVAELLNRTDLLAVMEASPVLVVAMPMLSTSDQSDGPQVYEVGEGLSLCRVGVAEVGDYLSSHTRLLRVASSLPAHASPHRPSREELLSALPESPPAFHIPSLHLLLPHNSHTTHPHNSHTTHPHKTLRQLFQKGPDREAYLPVEMLLACESGGAPLSLSLSSPLPSRAQLDLPLDTLALVHLDRSLNEVGVVLWEAIQRQLHAVVTAMLWKEGSLYNVALHHFPASPHHLSPLSLAYPHTPVASPNSTPIDDPALSRVRQAWHKALCLPQDRPLLRIINAHYFKPRPQGQQLLCPHTSLSYSPQGTVAMVTGEYAYHHYMQDNFNDDGWGCAYRSLQSLWSWFHLQGFTAQTPPTHRQMQEALVAVGDKPASLVGSREWIGSFEVSTVLNHLLGVESRIHHISSGGEMAGVGRVLLHHFTTHGTPVMVGGGVLAHTILGVDYNTRTGAIKFLILDPHYTGREELRTVISKGWCGWKPVGFWDRKAHYNMCMPQRPKEV